MWYPLTSDLNLVNAGVVEGGPTGDSFIEESPGESSVATISQSEDEASDTIHLDFNNSDNLKQLMSLAHSFQLETPVTGPAHKLPNSKPHSDELARIGKDNSLAHQAKGKFSGITREHIQTSSQAMTVDKKSGGSKKGSSANSKKDMLRQKTFHFEKGNKRHMLKGAFKAKVTAWVSMVLDKSLKSQSGSSSVVMKGTYSKLTIYSGTSGSLVEGKHHPTSNLQPGTPSVVLPVKDPISYYLQ